MLSKDKRLNLKTSFSYVVKGQKAENNITKIFFRQGVDEKPLVGIALKTEYFKKAVDRNRARRLASKAMENIYDKLPANINIIVMPKADILLFNSNEVTEQLEKIFKQIYLKTQNSKFKTTS